MNHNKPFFPPPKPNALMLINEISKLFQDMMQVDCKKIGMKSGYRHILFRIAMEDGLSQLDLVKMTHLKAPTISITLQSMESDELLIRQTDSDDQRQTRIYLTEKGRELDRNVQMIIKKNENCILNGISDEEKRILKEPLEKMRNNALKERR